MKVQKAISVLATLSILSFGVACNSDQRVAEAFAEGKVEGRAEGYAEGYADGDADGYARAEAYFKTADYTTGFNAGKQEGITTGYNQGYTVGKKDGLAQGYTNGYNVGYDEGDADGYARGKTDGYNLGYDDGYDDGYADGNSNAANAYNSGYAAGYDVGYDEGYDDGVDYGYDIGYDDGFDAGYDVGYDDGYGLSLGNTPKLKGYADVLSVFHNDLIDYSKISMPKQTKRGLVANGKLLLSEVSMTNKDTLKRNAVVEQYVVVEMAKQVKGKFGLSAERSLKVAKAANHFRKYATKRALTSEDTNAYAKEILGSDFKAISKAYEGSMKGNTSELNSILEKAAEKNEVSPEKMGEILTKMFI